MPAKVYVAWSEKGQLCKVGLSIETDRRIQHLNAYRYGGQSDWQEVFVLACDKAGRVEATAHTSLTRYSSTITYFNSGTPVECREMFKCGRHEAINAVKVAAGVSDPKVRPSEPLGNLVDTHSVSCNAQNTTRAYTVLDFSVELKMPPMALIEQLANAGVVKQSSTDTLSENDKARLLEFLRKSRGETAPKTKITLTRKQTPEIKSADSSGKARTIQVEVCKKRTFVKRDTEVAVIEPPVQAPVQPIAAGKESLAHKGTKYKKGERVRHPSKAEWGIGEVIADSNNEVVKIFFANAGEKSISLAYIKPHKVVGSEADSTILDQLQITNKVVGRHKHCTNCGGVTQFGENAEARRVALAWCDSCFKHSQRTFKDSDTGESRYFDGLRTVDGIKSRYSPK
jgi:hypothetical protein